MQMARNDTYETTFPNLSITTSMENVVSKEKLILPNLSNLDRLFYQIDDFLLSTKQIINKQF